MSRKIGLYTGLLVLALAAVGASLWFLFQPQKVIEIPAGEPVIKMEETYIMAGRENTLSIYPDGFVLYTEITGERPPGANTVKTWNTGKITPEKLNEVMLFLQQLS